MRFLDKPVEKGFLAVCFLLGISVWCLYPESFIADDSYFYLVVARNLALTGVQTFSDITVTNGVHPLWIYLLSGYSYLVSLWSPASLYQAAYIAPLSAALLAAGLILLWRVGTLINLPPFSLVIIPLTMLLGLGLLGSEAIVHFTSLCLLLLISAQFTHWTQVRAAVAGLICSCVILSRLDSIFIVAGFCLWHYFSVRRLDLSLIIISVCALTIVPYLAHNWFVFGSVVPISGWLKGTFPHIHFKGFELRGTITNFFGLFHSVGDSSHCARFYKSYLGRQNLPRARAAVFILLVGSLLQLTYIALFTLWGTLWHWYYVPTILLLSFSLNIFLVTARDRLACRPSTITYAMMALTVIAFMSIYSKRQMDFQSFSRASWYKAVRYVADNNIRDQTILVSDWPGYLAFFSPSNRILAADMLTSNRVFYEKMRSSDNALRFLLKECEKQGKPITHILWTGNCWIKPGIRNEEIVYNDPKTLSREIGRLSFSGETEVYQNGDDFVAWELPRRSADTIVVKQTTYHQTRPANRQQP